MDFKTQQRGRDKPFHGRRRVFARLDDYALSKVIAAAHTLALRYYPALVQYDIEDFEQTATLIAIEAVQRDLKDKDLLGFINRSLYYWFRKYGFSARATGAALVQVELDDRTLTRAFSYNRPNERKRHCGVKGCYNPKPGGADERFGYLCARHYSRVKHRKEYGFTDPYVDIDAKEKSAVCGVHGCETEIILTTRRHKNGVSEDRKKFCVKHYELFRQRRKAGWSNPYQGTPLKLNVFHTGERQVGVN